jgi:hypothetical protein
MSEQDPQPNSGREIVARIGRGELTPEQGIQLLQNLHPVKAKILGHVQRDNFIDRQAIAEKNRHGVAFLAYGLFGLIDGALDATFYAASEIAEDVAFGVSRIIYRSQDGWKRGAQRLEKGGK